MNVSLKDAETRLGELVERVEAGESIWITRDGKAVAHLTAVVTQPKPFDFAALRELTDRMPMSTQSAADLARSMRDEAY